MRHDGALLSGAWIWIHRRGRRAAILLLLFGPLVLACGRVPRIPAEGTLAGQKISTTVDSPLAKYYLEDYLPGERGDAARDVAIEEALALAETGPLDRYLLKRLSDRVSPDFATIEFVRRLYENPGHRRFQDEYNARFHEFTDPEISPSPPAPEAYRSYFLAFVPGYAYRMEPGTGADFAAQRRLMRRYGFETTLIETDELGSVEENAAHIAGTLERLAADHERIIVISTSKGGPEVALALGAFVPPDTLKRVRAWISIGGLLRGSPIADRWNRWPRSWVARFALPRAGYDPSVVRNLSTEVRRAAFDRLCFPSHLLTVQYVGVPLSGDVSPSARSRYEAMRPRGPNDGLTLLVDELIPCGNVVVDLGLDHFYRHPLLDLKALALAWTVLAELERDGSTPPPSSRTSTESEPLPPPNKTLTSPR